MRLRRLIKKNAALALRRHWCRAAAISLLTLLFWAVPATLEQLVMTAFNIASFVDVSAPGLMLDNMPNTAPAAMAIMLAIGVLSFFVIAPLTIGAVRWFYNITDGKALATVEIFEYFFSVKSWARVIWFYVLLFVKKLIWTVIFLAAPIAMIFGGNFWRQQASRDIEMLLSVGIEIFGGVLFLLLGWFWLMWMQRYALARYILSYADSLTAGKAIKLSENVARGRLLELLILDLSLIGWRIADIFVVPRLFTMPYINTVYSLYTRYYIEMQIREVESTQDVPEQSEQHTGTEPESEQASADEQDKNTEEE